MTIVIDDEELERQIAEAAATRNQTVQDYVIEALRASLPQPSSQDLNITERQKRVHAGRGALANIGLSSERFMAEKSEEKKREERHWRKQKAMARIRNGEYADLPTSSDDFAAQKAEEIEREEGRLRPH